MLAVWVRTLNGKFHYLFFLKPFLSLYAKFQTWSTILYQKIVQSEICPALCVLRQCTSPLGLLQYIGKALHHSSLIETVVFSVCVSRDNAVYMIFNTWNSISGLTWCGCKGEKWEVIKLSVALLRQFQKLPQKYLIDVGLLTLIKLGWAFLL